MPYLAFDLDAKKKVAPCARAAGVDPGVIAWGLLEMWEHVWSTKDDELSGVVLDGCFGLNPSIRPALQAYGFVERTLGDTYRARGAARFLKVRKAQSESGKAHASNLKRGTAEPEKQLGAVPGEPGIEPEKIPGPTPSTQHPAPSTQREEAAATAKPEEPPPHRPNPDSPSLKFFCWFQDGREQAGYVREVFSQKLTAGKIARFYSEAQMALNGDEEALREAAYRFGEDPYWRKQGCPFNGFIAQWRDYAPTRNTD